MTGHDYADAALLLIGHGSSTNAQSSAAALEQAEALRRRRMFARVTACFWKQEPGIAETLRGVPERRVFAVPFFVSEGYFTQQAVPQELGLPRRPEGGFDRVAQREGQTLCYCWPVGTHPRMTELLLSHAEAVVRDHPFPVRPAPGRSALLIAGHGTERSATSRQAVERQVEAVRARGTYAEVHALFLQEEPLIFRAYQLAQCRYLVFVPFFLSDGLHVDEDIPVLLGERPETVQQRLRDGRPTWRNPTEREGKLLWCAPSVGRDPAMAEVILERVREAAFSVAF